MNQTLAYRKNSNQNKKLAKVLAKAIFGVGFVTPLLFGNTAAAANFASGNVQWLNNEILNKTDATKWATTVGTDYSNYVYVDGYKFKIVKTEGTGANAKVTLWSYDLDDHDGTKGFGKCHYSNTYFEGIKGWGKDPNKAYGGIKNALGITVDKLISYFPNVGTSGDGKIYTVEEIRLASEKIPNLSGGERTVDYLDEDGYPFRAKLWLPSVAEVENGGTWGFSSDAQRAAGDDAWLRTPCILSEMKIYFAANRVENKGEIATCDGTFYKGYLRPAMQMLNQISAAFTTNVEIPTDGVFTADTEGSSPVAYTVNYDFNTQFSVSDGVTLDGTKIGIKTSDAW